MAPKNEDVLSTAYKYAWSDESTQPLDEFLKKFRPSMVENDGTKPWIWVTASQPEKNDSGAEEALVEASAVLKELTEKVESIKNDDSIPVRSSKKTGAKSKKEVREAAQAEATKRLEEISVEHGYVSGKWLIFAPAEKVDVIWSAVAKSLVSGPLSSTCAYSAKVATSPGEQTPNYQHVICVYIPDVYDKPKVLEVMKVLLRNHGLNLSGVKSNLYTRLDIDSKHPSGIQSTVWKNSALLPETEIKALKEAYFAELANKPAESGPNPAVEAKPVPATETEAQPSGSTAEEAKPKAKPKSKKKKEATEFESSDEDEPAPKRAKK
ncbi:hypothetical protein FA15DRAFT_646552 [Coprinopsis marcescibilis]|uniref:DUF1917-domain-containing protein n=1 Tax=Coprinopsis marcescibilis TaxID=230819 RepID=A0A5C3KLD5_COPMA|nr:hypothetical protein FA15DRAFT_646552 [Coprinopsis marcescibilis]